VRSPKHEKYVVNIEARKMSRRKPGDESRVKPTPLAAAKKRPKTSARPTPIAVERGEKGRKAADSEPSWTFLSNHTHVLVCLAADPEQTLRDVALQVGITERAVQRIVAELESAGALSRERDGRRNRYRLDRTLPLRHPLEQHCRIGDVLALVLGSRG
jgi:DNA-binding transcriptional ArsR family regulator